jgi:hypothetical protein
MFSFKNHYKFLQSIIQMSISQQLTFNLSLSFRLFCFPLEINYFILDIGSGLGNLHPEVWITTCFDLVLGLQITSSSLTM